MAKTRPYFLVFKGETHIIDAAQAAQAVQHVVGADVSELRPARASEVSAWVRAGKEIPIAGETATTSTDNTAAAESNSSVIHHLLAAQDQALIAFEDWAGFDRAAKANSEEATDTVKLFCGTQLNGQMDLMTFDVLRQRAREFEFAMVANEMGVPRGEDAEYVDAVNLAHAQGLPRLRARLEERPMPFAEVIKAILLHAGRPTA